MVSEADVELDVVKAEVEDTVVAGADVEDDVDSEDDDDDGNNEDVVDEEVVLDEEVDVDVDADELVDVVVEFEKNSTLDDDVNDEVVEIDGSGRAGLLTSVTRSRLFCILLLCSSSFSG